MGRRRDIEGREPDGHADAERKNREPEEAHRAGIGSPMGAGRAVSRPRTPMPINFTKVANATATAARGPPR